MAEMNAVKNCLAWIADEQVSNCQAGVTLGKVFF